MLIFNDLMFFSWLNGDHKGTEVLVRSSWSERAVRVVLSSFNKALLPLSIDLRLFLVGQKVAGVDSQGLGKL